MGEKANFTFRLDSDLRIAAERAAEAARWPLGTWIVAAMEEKLARDAAPPPARKKPAK